MKVTLLPREEALKFMAVEDEESRNEGTRREREI
jgi:hypothetical protein